MTITVVFGDESDGALYRVGATYEAARGGASATGNDTTRTTLAISNPSIPEGLIGVGQLLSSSTLWMCVEACVAFDLAEIPATDSIVDADLLLWQRLGTRTGYQIEARAHEWGPTLTNDDWVPGQDLADLDLLATLDATTDTDTLRTFVSSGLLSHVESMRGGWVRVLLSPSLMREGSTSSLARHTWFASARSPGTTEDPRLVIEHEPAADTSPFEAFDGTTWQPLPIETFDGAGWQPLAMEVVE